jgi:hypothetical protein
MCFDWRIKMSDGIKKWLEERARFGSGTRAKELLDYVNGLEKKAATFDECRKLLGTKDDDRFYESSTFANLRFVIGRFDT